MTEPAHVQEGAARVADERAAELVGGVEQVVREEFPEFDQLSPHARWTVVELWRRRKDYADQKALENYMHEEDPEWHAIFGDNPLPRLFGSEEIARDIGETLATVWQRSEPEQKDLFRMSRWQADNFVIAMCQAMTARIPATYLEWSDPQPDRRSVSTSEAAAYFSAVREELAERRARMASLRYPYKMLTLARKPDGTTELLNKPAAEGGTDATTE